MVLALACEMGWPVDQLDVVGAFLNASCDRDVYVKPAPEGQDLVDSKKEELTDQFEITDMGEVNCILDIEVQRDYEQGTIAISRGHYGATTLERFGMQDASSVSTPGCGVEISTDQPQGQLLGPTEKKLYQSTTGNILYLTQDTR